jgi:hypothetical protein
MANGDGFPQFIDIIGKIRSIESEYYKRKAKCLEIDKKKIVFLGTINQSKSLLTVFGVLCFAALIFDYFVNSRTLLWLPNALGTSRKTVYLFALIFSILDGGIAILASGTFARDIIAKIAMQKLWRKVLWSMAGLKIILFVIFIFITHHIVELSIIWVLLQVCFIVLIYVILHLAGEGIYYSLKSFGFWFQKDIWFDLNGKKKEYVRNIMKLKKLIIKYKNDKNAVFSYYKIYENIN